VRVAAPGSIENETFESRTMLVSEFVEFLALLGCENFLDSLTSLLHMCVYLRQHLFMESFGGRMALLADLVDPGFLLGRQFEQFIETGEV